MATLQKRIKKPALSPLAKKIKMISNGLPFKSFKTLQEKLNISECQLCEIVDINPKTLSRRRDDKRFTKRESDRINRITRIHELAVKTIGDNENANLWLKAPQLGLDNFLPIDLLNTEIGSREVEDLLHQIQYGIFS